MCVCPTVQNMASTHAAELGMQTVPSLNIAFTQEKGYVTADIADKEKLTKLNLSGMRANKGVWDAHVLAEKQCRQREHSSKDK